MSKAGRMYVVAAATIAALAPMSSVATNASDSYVLVDDWAKLPAGMVWGQVISVEPGSDGHIWAFHRAEPPILKFDPAGNLVLSFGKEMFVRPHGFHIDQDDFIWVSDQLGDDGKGHQVFKFSHDGELLMTLGTKGIAGDGPDTFNGPTDIAVSANGNIFVTDGHFNNRVVKFSKDGTFIKAWGTKGTGPGQFDLPHTIAIDSQGRLFVGDRSNARIQIFDQDGTFLEEWTQFGMPSGIFIDKDDTIYVADYQKHQALLIGSATNGSIATRIEPILAEGIAADPMGNVYAGEVQGRMLKKFAKH
jgi:DNA-binding beta-propeller fold protein YncE